MREPLPPNDATGDDDRRPPAAPRRPGGNAGALPSHGVRRGAPVPGSRRRSVDGSVGWSGTERPRHASGEWTTGERPAVDGARPDTAETPVDTGRRRWRRGSRGTKAPRSLRRTILEWAGVIGGGIVIALIIEAFLVQAFWIPSPSMASSLNVGDRVLVNKLSYRLHDVHRGDVIVFRRPPEASSGEEDIKDLIKRVVAIGGDEIEERDGLVYVNGERVDESDYLEPGTPTDNLPRQTVPEGHVFVMGDNRTNSEDSRVFGPVDEDRIVGRAFLRVLPLGDIGFL